MRAKVIKPFVDKAQGVTRKLGDSFTVSEERLKEINSTKFGVLVEAEPKRKPVKKEG